MLVVVTILGFMAALLLPPFIKLIPSAHLHLALAVGVLTAFVSLIINRSLIPLLGWDIGRYSRYAAPVIEESAKAVYLIALIRMRRVGFVVDAAIMGFAIGAGFAIIDEFANPSNVRCHNRHARRHCLHHGIREALTRGCEAEYIKALHKLLNIVPGSREYHALGQASLADIFLQRLAKWSIPYNNAVTLIT